MNRSPLSPSPIQVLSVILLALVLLIATPLGAPLAAPGGVLANDGDEVQAAWERAERIGTYEYSSNVVQTTTPALTLANVGRSPIEERLYIEGAVDRANDTMQMKMWSEDGSIVQGAGAIELQVNGGEAQGRVNGGDWQPVDGAADLFAPGHDPLGFLRAAQNVSELGTETRDFPTATITFTRYSFTLDGPTFARFMRDSMEADLARKGELPVGTHLDVSPVYAEMMGSGEIWVATDGLPLRLTIDLTFPPAEDEQITARLVSDFQTWGTAPGIAGWLSPIGSLITPAKRGQLAAQSAMLLAMAGFAVIVVRHRTSRRVYVAVVGAVILSLVSGPLMQTQQAYAFSERMESRQATQEGQREAQQAAEAQMAVETAKSWEPHQNPLATGSTAPVRQAASTTTGTETYVDDGTDIDGDGLTNVQEQILESDPTVADTDEDGLTDGIEVLELGTVASDRQQVDSDGDGTLEWLELGADSDGDGLEDGLEVRGFTFAGQHWYLNPMDLDTNGDGIADGTECDASTEETLTCTDTDGDLTPNVFDLDDDADGVPDASDLDANAVVGNLTEGLADNTFNFGFSDLAPDAPVYVDFQLRPTNPNHLWYTLNVLDWPTTDRAGQIQRVFTDTFGTSGQLADGDMRLVPMLEVSIPYEDGGYGNLPTLDSAPPITPSTPFEQWLDQDELDQFGISVRRLDDTGTLQAYVPLTLVREADGNNPLAFSARMFYRPKDRTGGNKADWGALQSARLLWMVEVMTDECTETPDTYEPTLEQDERREKWCDGETNWVSGGSSIQHVYEDDWYLTGLRVREEQGMQVAVAFQDPGYSQGHYTDLNTFHEGAVWSLAQGLEYSFLAGAGDDDGQRTMTVDTIAQRWDKRQNGSVPAEQRWNIPQDALLVERYNYEHQGLIATLAMTDTPELLNTFFTPTVNGGVAISPTLLFAHEERFRALSLTHQQHVQPTDGATWQNGLLQGNGLTMTVTEEAAPPVIRAGIKWAPFRYDSATLEWESYPLDEYWDVYEEKWASTLDDDLTDPDEVEAGTALISAYYLTFAHGLESLVELAGQAAEAAYQRGDTELVETLNGGGTELEALSSILDVQLLSFSSLEMGKRALNAVLKAVAVSEPINITQVQLELSDIAQALNPDIGMSVGDAEWAWLRDVDGTDLSSIRNGDTLSTISLGKHGPWLKKTQALAGGMSKLNDGLSIAGTVLALGWVLYDVGFGDEDEERKWHIEIAFNSINVALATVNLVAATSHLVLTVGLESIRSGTTALKALSNVYSAAQMKAVSIFKSPSAIIGVALATAVSISFFIYQVVSEGVAFASLAFNKALAAAIATIIVAVILLAIAAIPVVGPFISAIIGIIDALILVICSATNTSGDENFVCHGIAGMLSKVVEWAIYDQAPLVDMENSDRLNLTNFDIEVVDPEYGFTQGARLDVTVDVDTALYMDEIGWEDASPFIVYRWQFADTFLKQATFDYALQSMSQSSLHDDLGLDDMRDEWEEPDSSGWAPDANFVARTSDVQGQATYLDSGINAEPSQFYLAEGYAIPVQECAMIPIPYGPVIVPTPVCWIRSYKDTSHMNAGGSIGFDIFPRTLDGFYTLTAWDEGYFLEWDADFPVLKDADGDNLLSHAFAGPDPDDSKPDVDEDGLSDYLELAVGSDPLEVDTDEDTLTDYQEMQTGTDPRKVDTDRDGLMDGEEAYHLDLLDSDGDGNRTEWVGGWEIVYAFNGDLPVRTRVWSNPLKANEDNDDYLDAQERAYGLHPQVRSISNIIDLASEIQGSNVVRPGTNVAYEVALNNNLKGRAMEGLLGVDFPPALQNPTINPQNFQLLPRQGITLTGQVTVDPAISTSQAVSLTNIAGAVPTDLADEIAGRTLWLHLDETSGTSFVDSSLQGHNGLCQGSTCPQLNRPGYRQRAARFDGSDDRIAVNHSVSALGLSTGSYTVLAWIQPSVQHGNILSTSDGALSLLIDDYHPAIRINGGSPLQSSEHVTLGNWHRVAWRYDSGLNRYSIFLDGVLIGTHNNMAAPQLEGNETVVLGGPAPFFFGNMDDVEIFPYAISDAEMASRARGAQVFYFDFNQTPSRTQSWVDNSAYSNRIACELPDTHWECPQRTSEGAVGDGYRFARGTPAYTNLLRVGTPGSSPNLNLSRGNGSFSVAVWARPVQGRGTLMEYPQLTTDRGGDNGSIEIQFGPSNNRCMRSFQVPYSGSGPQALEGWHHIGVTFDGQTLRGYLDGNLLSATTACAGKRPESRDNFLIGGNDTTNQLAAPNGNGYSGWMDELRLYDYSLTPGQVEDLYWISLPSVELRFDEAPGRTEVRDSSLSGITGTCAGTGCPVTGVPGRINQAALFDGVDDAIQIGTTAQLGMAGRSFTVSTWVRADGNGTRPILGMDNAAGTATFALGLDNNVPYILMGATRINGSSALPTGTWHHLVWRYEYDTTSNIKRGDLYVNGALAGSNTNLNPLTGGTQLIYAGRHSGNYFLGLLDHIQIFRHSLTTVQRTALSTQAPIINLHMDTRVPAVSLYNRNELTNPHANAGAAGFAPTCSGAECPQVGTTGRVYQGQKFDGENDFLTIPSNITVNTLTMGMWVKPTEQKSKWQTLFAVEGYNYSNMFNVRRSRAGLYIKPNSNILHVASYCISGNLLWENVPNGQDIAPLFEDRWNHVMMTYDGSETVVYINGLEAFSSTSAAVCPHNATPRLGDSPNVGDGTGFTRFAGEMDEVVLYGEALSQDDVRELYTYQGNWVDVAYGHNIIVDADRPSIEFAPPEFLRTDQPTTLSVSAWDATSAIASVTYVAHQPGTGIVESGTLQQDGAVWLFPYQPRAGEQNVDITVTDQAGNQQMWGSRIFGDGAAPIPTLQTDGAIQPLEVVYSEADETWQVRLRGRVDNPDGDSKLNSPFNTLVVAVLDEQGVPVGDPLHISLDRERWELFYPFPTRPNGSYTVRMVATDSVGNMGTLERTISIDGTAPEARIGFPSEARTALNVGQVLTGTVVETGAASGVERVEISLVPAGWDNRSSAAWLDAGLRWHLPLDESRFDTSNNPTQQFHDATGQGNDATCVADGCPTAAVPGTYANAVSFDGSDDLLTVPVRETQAAFTVGAWVQPRAGGTGEQPFLAFANESGVTELVLAYDPAAQRFLAREGSTATVGNTAAAPDGWHHIMLSVLNDAATLYVNGQQAAAFTTTVRPVANGNLRLGSDGNAFFAGQLDDAVLYNRALPLAEVRQHWRGFGAVLRLGFDEHAMLDGVALPDGSRYEHTPVLHLNNDSQRIAVPGIVGAGALPLNGAGDYIEVPNHPAFDLSDGQFTQMAWLSLPALAAGSYYPIFSDEDGVNPSRFPYLAVVDNGKLRTTFNGEEYVTQPLLAANAWNFVATTFDGTTYRFYVNGILAEETNLFAGEMPPSDAQSFNIGRGFSSSTPYAQVTLDEVALFRQALSAEEIAVHYQQAWRTTALSATPNGAGNSQGLAAAQATAQWSYPVPTGVNDSVEIRLRTTDANGNVSFGAQGNERWSGSIVTTPQAITLAGFVAIPQTDIIRIFWETASEMDNAGFNLFRATSPDAQTAMQLNTELIASEAPGGAEGAGYEWVDSEVEATLTYYYWLEAVDLNEEVSRFGPVSASLEAPTALAVTEFGSGDASPLGRQLIALVLVTLALVFVVRRKRR